MYPERLCQTSRTEIFQKINSQVSCSMFNRVLNTSLYTFKRQPHKMLQHTQTIRRQKRTSCLSVSDQSLRLVLKRLSFFRYCQVTWKKRPRSFNIKKNWSYILVQHKEYGNIVLIRPEHITLSWHIRSPIGMLFYII